MGQSASLASASDRTSPKSSPVRAVITGTGRYAPEDVWTSDMVEALVAERSGGWRMPAGIIRLATGVEERRYAAPGECSSDLATKAAERALSNAGVDPCDIDLLIFASASHDVSEPATANIVQTALGCDRAAVMDVKNACNSFLNGLDVAQAFVETGRAPRVVVATGECLSPTIKWEINSADLPIRLAALTLGDAGAACVLEASAAPERGVLRGAFESDGRYWDLSTVLAGGSRYGASHEHSYFECRSAKLQQIAVTRIPALVNDVLIKLDWSLDDVACVVPHQVSQSVIEKIASLLGYPVERCVMSLDRFGNTAAASVPFALDLAIEEGRARAGDKVLLVGGAAGFSAAVVPLIL